MKTSKGSLLCLLLLLRIHSAHLEILEFPMDDAYKYRDIFCTVQNYAVKAEFTCSKCSLYSKRKLGVMTLKLQFGKECHTLLCILELFTN